MFENVTDFDRWAAEIEAEDNFQRNHAMAALYFSAKHDGYNIVVAARDEAQIARGKDWALSGAQIESREYKDAILNTVAVKSATFLVCSAIRRRQFHPLPI